MQHGSFTIGQLWDIAVIIRLAVALENGTMARCVVTCKEGKGIYFAEGGTWADARWLGPKRDTGYLASGNQRLHKQYCKRKDVAFQA